MTKLLESHESCGSNDTVMTKERFVKQVLERAAESWPEEGSLEEKWTAVQSALTETADQQLGRVSGNNPRVECS